MTVNKLKVVIMIALLAVLLSRTINKSNNR